MTITEARAIITQAFDDGDAICRSCGWSALESEHVITDDEIQEAIDGTGILQLSCQSKDDEDAGRHRGVRISLRGA